MNKENRRKRLESRCECREAGKITGLEEKDEGGTRENGE